MNTSSIGRQRNRLPLVMIALVCIIPVIAAYLAYYYFPRDSRTNYGELLATVAAPAVAGATLDGKAFTLADLNGKWVMLTAASGHCDALCKRALYATRQARTIQGRERERVTRLWLITDGATPSPALVAEHPDLAIARVAADALSAWPHGADSIYLIDPLGNEVLAWPREPDVKALARDLTRLLGASQIG